MKKMFRRFVFCILIVSYCSLSFGQDIDALRTNIDNLFETLVAYKIDIKTRINRTIIFISNNEKTTKVLEKNLAKEIVERNKVTTEIKGIKSGVSTLEKQIKQEKKMIKREEKKKPTSWGVLTQIFTPGKWEKIKTGRANIKKLKVKINQKKYKAFKNKIKLNNLKKKIKKTKENLNKFTKNIKEKKKNLAKLNNIRFRLNKFIVQFEGVSKSSASMKNSKLKRRLVEMKTLKSEIEQIFLPNKD